MKKAIIFDCDNTLWQGIVGEESIIHDAGMQQDIVFLANHGVIIGLCSKNNEEDVIKALENQILREEHISVKRINWKDKVSNLKEIAQELNIGMDAIMFVDDSLFERNLIREYLPEVLTIMPQDLMKNVLECFDLTGTFSKTQQYKENYLRAKAETQFTDIEEYLASLKMVLSIKINEQSHIPRITELTQKTNQFNLTTNRHDKEDIAIFMETGRVYSLSVKDRFGDNGIVGVCIVVLNKIETFLLSCRVLGRGIEYAFFDYVIEMEYNYGKIVLLAEYKPTAKNKQTKNFYGNVGFECFNITKENVMFSMGWLENYTPKAKKYFRYE